jgi:hypothetical protein
VKRIVLAAVGAAVAGLTACSSTGEPAASPVKHGKVIVPVSCRQQYRTWQDDHGKELVAALHAVSSAESAGNTQVLVVALKRARPAVATAARHPMPACADPVGYWSVLLMHVNAGAASTGSPAVLRAAMKDVPKIDRQLADELKRNTK